MMRALLLLGVVVACLVAGGGVLRALGFGRDLVYEYDERLVWRLAPNQDAFAPSYGIRYRIDGRGRRVADSGEPVGDGERWVGLGDSVLFGQGVSWEETLAGRLGARQGVSFENNGVPGYSIYQYRRQLDDGLEALGADRLLLSFVKNDVVSPRDIAELARRARSGLMEGGSFATRRLRAASAWVHVGSGAWRRLEALWAPASRALAYVPPQPEAANWRYTLELLDEIAEEARRVRVPLAVVAFPTRQETETGRVWLDLAPIRERSRRWGFPVVDLHAPFVARRDEGLFLDPVHPSAQGNAVAAEAVVAALADWF